MNVLLSKLNRPPTLPFLIFLTILMLGGQAAAGDRPFVPTPPGGGEGISISTRDDGLPSAGFVHLDFEDIFNGRDEYPVLNEGDNAEKGLDEIGGDDITIDASGEFRNVSMDITEAGVIYMAYEIDDLPTGMEIIVRRSFDGGDTWEQWGEISSAASNVQYWDPSLHVAEGISDQCYLAYIKTTDSVSEIAVAGSELSLSTGDFSGEVVVMSNVLQDFYSPCLVSDASNYSGYYLYLAAWAYEDNAGDIYFARSTDQCISFESDYPIASIVGTDRDYRYPTISYGFGGNLHVAWEFSSRDDGFDSALRYRSAASYGDGGLSAWGNIKYLNSTNDGVWDEDAQVAASLTSSDVVIAYERRAPENSTAAGGILEKTGGATEFDSSYVIPYGPTFVYGLEQQPATGNWILAGRNSGHGFYTTTPGSPLNWGYHDRMSDHSTWYDTSSSYGFALDPSHDDRVALAWAHCSSTVPADPDTVDFDAEWRADPGYPNLEDGFPLDLDYSPVSAPGLVDLDQDGDQEIVFGDTAGNIQILHHDGTLVDGWPVNVGTLSSSPIAVGDLVGLGNQVVVAGTANGYVYAFDQYGDLLSGFPYLANSGEPVYLCLGALGGHYARTIVAGAGTLLQFINHHGERVAGSVIYNSYTRDINHPPAVGDINGDGVNEVVWAQEDYVVVGNIGGGTMIYNSYAHNISDALTLGDADLDGDMEIAVPLEFGTLHVLDADGSEVSGFPVTTASASHLSSVAWSQILGTSEPELAFAANNYTVELYYADGNCAYNWPRQTTTGWWIWGAPIMGRIDGSSSDVIIGARDQKSWAWSNIGQLISGWPKTMGNVVHMPPAMGDIDLDGSAEVVFLSQTQLLVVDVNNSINNAARTWPMYGHDPRRTGCHNCPEDVVSAVEDDPGEDQVITRVSFAAPSPNPASSSTLFTYELPALSQVRLEVFDIRGHRVRTVLKSEVVAGSHAISWNCRDDDGRQMPSGTYFGRLRVRGPGVNNELSRKINLIR